MDDPLSYTGADTSGSILVSNHIINTCHQMSSYVYYPNLWFAYMQPTSLDSKSTEYTSRAPDDVKPLKCYSM